MRNVIKSTIQSLEATDETLANLLKLLLQSMDECDLVSLEETGNLTPERSELIRKRSNLSQENFATLLKEIQFSWHFEFGFPNKTPPKTDQEIHALLTEDGVDISSWAIVNDWPMAVRDDQIVEIDFSDEETGDRVIKYLISINAPSFTCIQDALVYYSHRGF